MLWTSLEPCLQCAGAIRFAGISRVRYLCDDPICDGLHLTEITRSWRRPGPTVEGPLVSPLATLGILSPLHVSQFWVPEALPPPRSSGSRRPPAGRRPRRLGRLAGLAEAGHQRPTWPPRSATAWRRPTAEARRRPT